MKSSKTKSQHSFPLRLRWELGSLSWKEVRKLVQRFLRDDAWIPVKDMVEEKCRMLPGARRIFVRWVFVRWVFQDRSSRVNRLFLSELPWARWVFVRRVFVKEVLRWTFLRRDTKECCDFVLLLFTAQPASSSAASTMWYLCVKVKCLLNVYWLHAIVHRVLFPLK